MSNISKKDELTISVKEVEQVEKERSFTLDELDDTIDRLDSTIEELQTRKQKYVAIREEALKLGVKHRKDLTSDSPFAGFGARIKREL